MDNGNTSTISAELIRSYLLGELEPSQCDDVERRLSKQADSSERLERIEAELIEAYVGGKLRASDRENFERWFLCTEDRRLRVAVIEGLSGCSGVEGAIVPVVSTYRRGFRPGWLFPAAACTAVLLVGISVFAGYQVRENARMVESERELRAELLRRTKTPSSLTSLVSSVTLRPASTNRASGASPVIAMGTGASSVQLRIVPPADARIERYRAVLSNFNGEEVFLWEQRRPSPVLPTIELTLPLELLPDDDYRLTLSAHVRPGHFDELATYVFRIARK